MGRKIGGFVSWDVGMGSILILAILGCIIQALIYVTGSG